MFALTRPVPSPLAARAARFALRSFGMIAVALICAWFLGGHLADLDHTAVMRALRTLTPLQWAGGVLATMLAFVAVSRQERVIMRHFGLRPDPRHAAGAAMAAAAISQTVGFGPLVGAVVRVRLLPELGAKQSFLVSTAITIGFFAGAGLVMLGWLALSGQAGMRWLGVLGLLVAVALIAAVAVLPRPLFGRFRLPPATAILALLGWVAVDMLALSFAFWALMPVEIGHSWFAVILTFAVALSVGLASGSPAGTGPFEAIVLTQLHAAETETLLAGMLAFRAVAYGLPALVGAIWALVGRAVLPAPQPCPAIGVDAATADLAHLNRAEVQLARQGQLDLISDTMGQVWATTSLLGQRVFVGDPASRHPLPPMRAMAAPLQFAAFEGRAPLFYKINARHAAAARSMGLRVLRSASEAVLDPRRFDLAGPAHASLRRKLRHAAKAGITVAEIAPPQADSALAHDMARLAADWRASHGGERGLTTGRWCLAYLAGQRVFAAYDGQGRMVAFVSFHATGREWVLDLIRFGHGVPDGTLYAILVAAIGRAAALDVARFSLAAVPVAQFGLTGPLGRLVGRFSAQCHGLAQFKSAFAPQWEPRYVAAPTWAHLILGGIRVAIEINLPGWRYRSQRRLMAPLLRSKT